MIDILARGGAQKLLVTFAAEARRRGIKVTVVCLSDNDHTSVIADELVQEGAQLVRFPSARLADPVRLWRIIRFLRRERATVVHTHLTYANILGTLAARIAGVPVVSSLHLAGLDPDLLPRKQQIENAVLRTLSNGIIAVGYAAADEYRSLLNNKPIEVIHNAVDAIPWIDETQRTAIRTELLGDPARPMLLSVGRLTSIKALPDMVDAFAQVASVHPEATLIMVGSGDQQAAIEQRIAHHGLADRVSMIGARDDIPRLLPAADLFVSSSYREGLPIAVLEAMAAGLPVVATSVGDVPRVVVEGTGVVVPPHQPEQLASAINRLLADPAQLRAMGASAKAHVTQHHSPAVWVDQLMNVYIQAVEAA
jgi:glycosyltransferase involved in cell wall biosynthesis